MHLLRSIFFFSATFDFNLTAAHIPGRYNTLADAISKNNAHLFLSSYPQATPQLATVPHDMIRVLLIEKPELDVKQLDTLVSFYFRASLAPSSTHSYESAKRKYLQFCSKSNETPIPVTEGKLCSFVAFVANSGLARQTIKYYLSAIRHLQIESGTGEP